MNLIRLVTVPYVRKHALRTVLTAIGVALGVAVFVGMHTANQSVLAAFTQTIDRIAGKTDLQITSGDNGFGEDILEKIQSASEVAVAVPVIEAVVDSRLLGTGSLLVLGIDMTGDRSLRDYALESGDDTMIEDPLVFLAQPDSIVLSKELADRHQLSIGGSLPLLTANGDRAFTVRGIMKPAGLATAFGGNLAVMDVYAAQKMFGRGRTFDRIDLAVAPAVPLDRAERSLQALLGPGFEIQPPAGRGQQAESMLAGYTVMVNLSSAFALFIGMFIIYNAFATAVTQRRFEIGMLRALGATRRQVRLLFLGEGVVLGLLGSLIGAAVGVAIAGALASTIGSILAAVYGVNRQANTITVSATVLAVAVIAGIVTSVLGAAIPANGAAAIDPIGALRKGTPQPSSARQSRLRVALAAILAGCSIISLTITQSRPLFYAGYGCALAATVLMGPLLTVQLAKAIRPLLKWLRPVEGALAADSLIQSPRRTSATVAALMLSVALIVAFSGMARASYGSITDWLNTVLNPDLFVMPSQRLDLRTTRFPASMADELAQIPGVARVQRFRNGRITFRDKQVMAVALDMDSVAETVRTAPIAGTAPDMYRRAAAGEGIIVSENLAQLHHLALGDVPTIQAPYGTIRLPIVGIIVDYTDQQGAILMDRAVFNMNWRDDTVNDFRLFLDPGVSPHEVRQRIVGRYAGTRQVFVLTNEESRRYVLRITDQWFSVMNVQIVIAVLVAILGIVNSLTVSITDRRRELGVLQAVGGLRMQIRRTIWIEALAVATLGLILGCALGGLNLYYVLQVVRRDVMGIHLMYEYPIATALELVPVMLAAAWIAALWPAESAIRGRLVEALEYE